MERIGYKKHSHLPRQRDNYIDKELMQEQPSTQKRVKKDMLKTQRVIALRKQLNSDNKLFNNLKISSLTPFMGYNDKVECKCKRNIRFYCLKCQYANPNLPFPKLKLPCKTVILHHPEEKASKSSGLPLTLLSQDIQVIEYKENMSEVLQHLDTNDTYILYPHKDSIEVSQLQSMPKTIIAVDCTWFQTNTVLKHIEESRRFKYIKLKNYETQFWRYQNHGGKALSTAEAVFYFYKELAQKFEGGYNNQYDELLYLYVLNYHIIENYHKGGRQEKTEMLEQLQEKSPQNPPPCT